MKSLIMTGLTVVLIIGLIFQSAGCATWSNPNVSPKIRDVRGRSIIAIEPGSKVQVALVDGRTIKGRYRGSTPLASDLYSAKYEEARGKLGERAPLPELGEPITLRFDNAVESKFTFAGFDPEMILVRVSASDPVRRADLGRLKSITDNKGGSFDPTVIREFTLEGSVPSFTAALLTTDQGKLVIPLNEIGQMVVEKKSHAPAIAAAAAVFGLVYIVFFGAYMRDHPFFEGVRLGS